jgi:hypothetical protein
LRGNSLGLFEVAGGYTKTSIVDGDILTEITALGRDALAAYEKRVGP